MGENLDNVIKWCTPEPRVNSSLKIIRLAESKIDLKNYLILTPFELDLVALAKG